MIRLEKIGYLTASEAIEFLGISRQGFYNFKGKTSCLNLLLRKAG